MAQKPMTKAELVAALVEKTGLGKGDASRMLGALAEIVTGRVAGGGAVTLPGLGKFACRDRPERTVRNPATGEAMTKPADRTAKVVIAKPLKEAVNA